MTSRTFSARDFSADEMIGAMKQTVWELQEEALPREVERAQRERRWTRRFQSDVQKLAQNVDEFLRDDMTDEKQAQGRLDHLIRECKTVFPEGEGKHVHSQKRVFRLRSRGSNRRFGPKSWENALMAKLARGRSPTGQAAAAFWLTSTSASFRESPLLLVPPIHEPTDSSHEPTVDPMSLSALAIPSHTTEETEEAESFRAMRQSVRELWEEALIREIKKTRSQTLSTDQASAVHELQGTVNAFLNDVSVTNLELAQGKLDALYEACQKAFPDLEGKSGGQKRVFRLKSKSRGPKIPRSSHRWTPDSWRNDLKARQGGAVALAPQTGSAHSVTATSAASRQSHSSFEPTADHTTDPLAFSTQLGPSSDPATTHLFGTASDSRRPYSPGSSHSSTCQDSTDESEEDPERASPFPDVLDGTAWMEHVGGT